MCCLKVYNSTSLKFDEFEIRRVCHSTSMKFDEFVSTNLHLTSMFSTSLLVIWDDYSHHTSDIFHDPIFHSPTSNGANSYARVVGLLLSTGPMPTQTTAKTSYISWGHKLWCTFSCCPTDVWHSFSFPTATYYSIGTVLACCFSFTFEGQRKRL